MQQAINTAFPPQALTWALGQHLAPRVVQGEGISSSPQLVSRSILAGCKHSIALVKMYLKEDLSRLMRDHTSIGVSAYVDDITITARQLSRYDLTIQVLEAMRSFSGIANKLKLVLSDKGQLVCSDTRQGAKVAKSLSKLGIPVTHVYQARDLGVVNAAGKHVRRLGARARITATRQRVAAIKNLSRISPMARKLYSGSAYSASTWGHMSRLLSTSTILQIERDAANSSGIKIAGRNLFMTNVVAYGKSSHPVARLYTDMVKSHFSVLDSILDSHISMIDFRKAWSAIYAKVAKHISTNKKALHKSTGPIYNTICMLLAIGWDPVYPDLWKHEGQTYVYNNRAPVSLICKYVVDTINQLGCTTVEEHYCGKGAGEGLSLDHSLSVLYSLKRRTNKLNPDVLLPCPSSEVHALKGALECLLAGSFWPAERVRSIKPEADGLCAKCGQLDTPLHQFWTCSHLDTIDDNRIASTQDLVQLAVDGSQHYPCLWLRGLLPASMLAIPDMYSPIDKLDITYVAGWQPGISLPTGTYFTDASGGLDHDVPSLRRCGVGICASPPLNPIGAPGGLHYPLPGEVQTVPRGELHAIVTLADIAVEGASILVYSDNLQVVKACQGKGPHKPLNSDLLDQLRSHIKNKNLVFQVEWIKSHLSPWQEDSWPTGVTKLQVVGNYYADRYAGEAANKHKLPADISAPTRQALQLVRKIQLRLAVILCHQTKHKQSIQESKPPVQARPPPLYTLFDASRHTVFCANNRLHCTYCQASVPTRSRQEAVAWLDSPCNCSIVKIGNKYTHHTHSIQSLKGLVFCVKCGLFSTQQLKGLAEPLPLPISCLCQAAR